MGLKLSRKILPFFAVALAMVASVQNANAADFRVGVSLGLGGAGIDSSANLPTTANDGTTELSQVSRDEGPGIVSIFADKLISDRYAIGIEHTRGFRFGPASSGVSFTGLMGRWYWSGFAPSMISSDSGSTLLVKRFTPFVGLMAGLAKGSVERADPNPGVDGSGIYVGIKLGADYPIAPGIYIRPEISTASTIMSQGAIPTTLKLFGLQCGLFFAL